MPKTKKIVIIGAGIIGASIAWNLAKRGYKPIILEKENLLETASSSACEGLMFLQSKKPGIHLNMAIASIKLYEDLQKELGVDLELERRGGVIIIHSKREMDILKDYVIKQNQSGANIEMIDAKTIKEMVPQVAKDVLGGSFSRDDSVINPLKLTHGLLANAVKKGVIIHQNTNVEDIILENKTVTKVITNKGNFEADLVINAAGSYGAKIAAMVGLDIPLKPRKGEIMVTAPMKKVLKYPLMSATYIAAKYDPEIAKEGTGFAVEQVKNGNILIGSTREFVDFDDTSTIKAIQSIARGIKKTLPGLGKLKIIRDFVGFRPYTPDGLPFIGEHKKVKGFFFACGHEGDGITLCAITGQMVSEMIDDIEPQFDMENFNPSRFDNKGET